MIQEFIDTLMNACYTKTSCISVSDKINNLNLSFSEIIYDVRYESLDDNRTEISINGSGGSEITFVVSESDKIVFEDKIYFITTKNYDYVFSFV